MKDNILEEIKEKWNTNNLQESSDYLDKLSFSATTGSEIIELIGVYLMSLKRENKIEYNVARHQIDKYFINY